MCEIAKDLIIGTIAGIVSSLIVTKIWNQIVKNIEKKNNDKNESEQFKELFSHEIQLECRYLDRVQLELDFPESEEKRQNVLRVLDSQPTMSSFRYGMNDEGKEILLKIHNIIHEIENCAKRNELNMAVCKVNKNELFKLEVELLKRQYAIRVPWAKYKECYEKGIK